MTATIPSYEVVLDAQRRRPSLRGTMLAAGVVICVTFGGFLAWATTARLDRGAFATGSVVVDSHRKTVSHLEGGILSRMLVMEGDTVKAGRPLLLLDATQADSILGQVRGQYWAGLARSGRLTSEQAGQRAITFPDTLLAEEADPRVKAVMAAEERLFQARWTAYDGSVALLRGRVTQLGDQLKALRAQLASVDDRLRYTEDELRTVKQLFERGYERRPRLLELQRSVAELQGDRSALVGSIAQAEEGIASTELEIVNAQHNRQAEVSRELADTAAAVADAVERLRNALDVARRREVVAPQEGKVTDIRFFTAGGVIPAGAPILDIVPLDDEKIVEARLNPRDIDTMRVGLPAQVRMLAYRQRQVSPLDGEVIYVSADQSLDTQTGERYFTIRVRLKPEALENMPQVELYPGMPAEVVVSAGERLAIDYFTAPIRESMRRAFRED